MIIIEQNFNKVPLCLEGTKENSPFAVSGPALVVVYVCVIVVVVAVVVYDYVLLLLLH